MAEKEEVEADFSERRPIGQPRRAVAVREGIEGSNQRVWRIVSDKRRKLINKGFTYVCAVKHPCPQERRLDITDELDEVEQDGIILSAFGDVRRVENVIKLYSRLRRYRPCAVDFFNPRGHSPGRSNTNISNSLAV